MYSLGIIRKKYQGKERMRLSVWNGMNSDNKLVEFPFDYAKESFLNLQGDEKVPWGTAINVDGQLWFRNEPFTSCSGTVDMQGKKIIFTGNDVSEANTLTDGFAKFSTQILVGHDPRTDCFLQAHYEGDPVFFDKCDSNIISYEITKHESSLSLDIEPLVPKLADLLESDATRVTLKAGQFYLLKGHLRDKTLDRSIPDRIVKFVGPVEFHLSPVVTNLEGRYTLCTKIPDNNGAFSIEAIFEGEEHYRSSTAKISFEITPDLFSQIPEFKQFKAFDFFKNGFEDLKEHPQVKSSIWLLSLLDANPIPLGIFDKDGEQIMKNGNKLNYSGDILAIFEGVPIIVDCTVSVPNTQKIDKISNTAEYLTKTTGKRIIPLMISNQPGKAMRQEAYNNQVLLLDQTDISEILDLVLDNKLIGAKQLFLNKLRQII
jgi:hypothetical protein